MKKEKGWLRRQKGRKRLLPVQIGIFFFSIGCLALWYNSGFGGDVVMGAQQDASQGPGGRHLLSEFPSDALLSIPAEHANEDGDVRYKHADNKHWLALHCLGVVYMFSGLAIVCDDYFVAALEEICERFNLSEDVAGATFMAAGGSAPELFTAMLGVFVAKSDVGFGTIVGSAVFNVLFVIALCALFAKETLSLTWWPLFRDCSFYSLGLLVLTWFVSDQEIHWYEAAGLLFMYVMYVVLMKYNIVLQAMATRFLERCKRTKVNPAAAGAEGAGAGAAKHPPITRKSSVSVTSPAGESGEDGEGDVYGSPVSRGGALFVRSQFLDQQGGGRQGKPTDESGADAKAEMRSPASGRPPRAPTSPPGTAATTATSPHYTNHHAADSGTGSVAFPDVRGAVVHSIRTGNLENLMTQMAAAGESVRSLSSAIHSAQKPARSVTSPTGNTASRQSGEKVAPLSSAESGAGAGTGTGAPSVSGSRHSDSNVSRHRSEGSPSAAGTDEASGADAGAGPSDSTQPSEGTTPVRCKSGAKSDGDGGADGDAADDDEEEADSPFEIPEKTLGRVMWLVLLPLNTLMYFTIPPCQTAKWKNWYMVTFGMSLVWIALYAYMMVWWASIIGYALGIPDAVMGLTVLAAGTSIPDAISSVIVARNGFGDMAVSSSIGSNVFDINMGLPLPWLIKTAIVEPGSVVDIKSCGLPVLVVTLLLMVLFVVTSIRCTGWKLNHRLGGIMFLLYIIFVTQSLLMEYGHLNLTSC